MWLCLCLCLSVPAGAQTIIFSFDNISQPIPDDSALGLSDTRTITTPGTSILSVTISMKITGDFNGDLYAQVTHSSGFSVLLNRVGRTASNDFGYNDAGFDVTFRDNAANGDVHVYRTTLFGNENTIVSGGLSGTWSPDGRTTDPAFTLSTDPRAAFLSSFNGLDPNGTWTIFIADTSAGGQSILESWAVNLDVVPEPASVALLITGVCLLGVPRRRRRPGHAAKNYADSRTAVTPANPHCFRAPPGAGCSQPGSVE